MNPGNIRRTPAVWQGQAEVQHDPEFVVFKTMAYGIRALVLLLQTYRTKYGLDTVRKIIGRWAPPNENDTEAYIRAVCAPADLDPDDELPDNRSAYEYLARQIAIHENGAADAALITNYDWSKGLELVFGPEDAESFG